MFNPFAKHNRYAQLSHWVSTHLFNLIIIVVGICILFSPPVDNDFGWHFKYGEYIWQHLSLLRENTFSYTFPNHQFINSYWLSEMAMYFFHQNFGHILGSIIPAILISITLLIFAKKSEIKHTSVFLWFVTIATGLSLYHISIRPFLYSTIFFYILLYTLIFETKLQKYLPILFLIWTNSHADFVLGLFIYGIYTLAHIKKKDFDFKKLLVPASSVLVTIINPNGINLWITIFHELSLPFNKYVHEWSSLNSLDSFTQIPLIIFGIVFLIAGIFSKKPEGIWYKVLVIFFFVFGLKSIYMLRIEFILGSVGMLYMADLVHKLLEKHVHFWLKNIFILGITYTLLIGIILNILVTKDQKAWAEQAHYPYEAVRFLNSTNLKGNIFNNYNWGGYLIWKSPKNKTFIDGRMTSWKDNNAYFMENYYKITNKPEINNYLFRSYLKTYNIRYVLDRPGSVLVEYLTLSNIDRWRLIFVDANAVVLEKVD